MKFSDLTRFSLSGQYFWDTSPALKTGFREKRGKRLVVIKRTGPQNGAGYKVLF